MINLKSLVEVAQRSGIKNHFLANAYSLIGLIHKSNEDLEESLLYLEKALSVNEELGNPTGIVRSLLSIESVNGSLQRFEESLYCLNRALLVAKKHKLPDFENRIRPLLQFRTLFYKGEYDKILPYIDQLYESVEGNNIQNKAEMLRVKGHIYYLAGKCDDGLMYCEQALKIFQDLNLKTRIAQLQREIGVYYGSELVGRYEKALTYLENSLATYISLKKTREEIECRKEIGTVYTHLGLYDKAIFSYETALKLAHEDKYLRSRGNVLHGMGYTYRSLGQYEKALSYYEQSRKIRMQCKQILLATSNLEQIGQVYRSLGQYDKAQFYFVEAQGILESGTLRNPIMDAMYSMNIGLNYVYQKKYREAEDVLLKVEEVRKTGSGIRWKGVPGLVRLYIETKRYDEALSYLGNMQPEWFSDDNYRLLFYTQDGLALKGKHLLKEASHSFLQAVSVSENMRTRTRHRSNYFAGEYAGIDRTTSYKALTATLAERYIKSEQHDDAFSQYGKDLGSAAFYFSELTKARTLLESMAASAGRKVKAEMPADMLHREQDIIAQLTAIERRWEELYKRGDEGSFKSLMSQKEKLQKDLDALVSTIQKQYPRYAALHYPVPVRPENLPLKRNETLLAFAVYEDSTYLFEIREGNAKRVRKIPISREDLEKSINTFLQPMHRPNSGYSFSESLGHKLYKLLLQDALKDVADPSKVVIVPDGILGILPFEVLVMEQKKGRDSPIYVGDKCSIAYAQSASVLAFHRVVQPSMARNTFFGLGNPIYNRDDERYIAYKSGKHLSNHSNNSRSQSSFRSLAARKEWGKTTNDDAQGVHSA